MDGGVVVTGELQLRVQDGKNLRQVGFILPLNDKWHATSDLPGVPRKSVPFDTLHAASKMLLDQWASYKAAKSCQGAR
jgi:hypothetical protein